MVAHQGVVGDDDDRRLQLGIHAPKRRQELRGRGAVKLTGRLVGEQDRRLVGERDGHGDALLLAARELAGMAVPAGSRHADEIHQQGRALAALAGIDAVEEHRQLDVLGRREVTQQVALRLLPDEADDPAPIAVLARPSMRVRSCPATMALPAEGMSRPPRMFMSVDLPLPDAPTSAIISAGSTCRSRP